MDERNYYTVKEVAKVVFNNEFSTSTIHTLIKSGEIPYVPFSVRKFLIPAWWVKQTIAQAHNPV